MRTVTFKITSFPTIIIYRVRVVGFKITSLTAAIIKLRSILKRIISVYIASRQTEIAFKVLLAERYRLLSFRKRGLSSIKPLLLPYKTPEPVAATVKAILKTTMPLANFL